MSTNIGGLAGPNQFGRIIYDPDGPLTIGGLTQGFGSGELWGCNGKIFVPYAIPNVLNQTTQKSIMIPGISFEKMFLKVLHDYVEVATSELNLQLPYTVELGAGGLKGVYLACPGGPSGNGTFEGPIMEDVQKSYTLTTASYPAMESMLRSFFIELYDLAACSRSDVLTDQLVAQYGLPPR